MPDHARVVRAELVVRDIGRLVTCRPELGDGALGVIEDAALAAAGGRVVWTGPDRELHVHVDAEDADELDAEGRCVLPGLVECHTHLLYAGHRRQELLARAAGGRPRRGVMTTVAATREAPDEQLRQLAARRLDRLLAHGVTTVEVKSGYGLHVDQEARLVEVASTLGHAADVVTTVLAAHVIPPDRAGDPDRHLDDVRAFLLPRVRGRAEFCDVVCDAHACTAAQCRRVLEAARDLGFKLRVHAEHGARTGGAALAAELGATSADGLEHATEDDAAALAAAGVVAVLMPGAALMGHLPAPPARALLDRGARVALSTGCGPGASPSENLQLAVALGCALLGMSVEEAILGVTRAAAAAIARERVAGSLGPGMRCDALLLDASHEADLVCRYGVNLAAAVVKGGRVFLPPSIAAPAARA